MATDPRPEHLLADPTDPAAATGKVVAGEFAGRPKQPLRALLRGALFVVFAGVLLAFGFDRWTRHQMQIAFDAVDEALQTDHESGRLRAADVHRLIGREPDQPAEPPLNVVEVYHWRGAARQFSLFVVYTRDGELKDVAADAMPAIVRGARTAPPSDMDEPAEGGAGSD